MGVGGQRHAQAALHLRKRPGSYCYTEVYTENMESRVRVYCMNG
jgi:hypothetical protein